MFLSLNFIFLWVLLMMNSFMSFLKLSFLMIWVLFIWKLLSVYSHLLIILLSLEALMLLTMNIFNLLSLSILGNISTLMTFFTLAVCEASLGLGLLISLSRQMGSEQLNSFFSFKLIKTTYLQSKFYESKV